MAPNKDVSFTIRVQDLATGALKQVEDASSKAAAKIFSLKDILSGFVATAAAFSLTEVIKDLIDLGTASDKTFRGIAANLPTGTEGIRQLKEELGALAIASGRSLESIQELGAGIAKMGVSSAEELKQVAEASALLSDATGEDLSTTSSLLIQTKREFGVTGDEALATAAKIASIAKGKAAIGELLTAFQASTPVFKKFDIDVDTGVRALGSLVEQGYVTSKAIRGALTGQDAEGIRAIASGAKVAADALGDLRTRADEVRGGLDRVNERINTQVKVSLEEAGTKVANFWMYFKLGLAGIVADSNWAVLQAKLADALGMKGLSPVLSVTTRPTATDQPTPGQVPGAHWKLPETVEERKKREDDANKAAEAEVEITKLAIDAHNRAADAIAKEAEEARKLRAEITQQLDLVTGSLAQAAAAAADQHATELQIQIALNETLSLDEKTRLSNSVEQWRLMSHEVGVAREAVVDVDEVIKSANLVGATNDAFAALTDKEMQLRDVQRGMKKDSEAYKIVQDAILKIEQERKQLAGDLSKGKETEVKDAKDLTREIIEQARAIQQAVDGGIQLAEAFGLMDQRTGNALRSIGQIAAQIPVLVDQLKTLDTTGTIGGVIGAAFPIAGALATLVSGLFHHGASSPTPDPVAQQQLETLKKNTEALARAAAGLDRYGNTLSGSDYSRLFQAASSARLAGGWPNNMSFDEFAALAKKIGISFAGLVPTMDEVQKVLDQLAQIHFDDFTHSLDGLLQVYQAGISLFDVTDPDAQYKKLLDTLGAASGGGGALSGLLEGSSIGTAGGRSSVLATIQALFKKLQAGQLTAEDLGGMTPEQFLQELLNIKQLIESASKSASAHLQQLLKDADDALAMGDTGAASPTDKLAAHAKAYEQIGGSLGDLLKQFDLDHLDPDAIAHLDAGLRDLFKKLHDSPGDVDLAGLSVDELIAALLDLHGAAADATRSVLSAAEAMAKAAAAAAAETQANVNKANLDRQVLGLSDQDYARRLAGALGFQFDASQLSTAGGRDQLLDALVQLYQSGGGLGPEKYAQIIQALRAIKYDGTSGPAGSGLGALAASLGGAGSVSAATAGVQSLTTIQGDRIVDLEYQQVHLLADIRDLMKLSTPNFSAATLGLPALLGSVNSISSITLGPINVTVHSLASDPKAFGREIADEFAYELDKKFGLGALKAKIQGGDISV